VTIVTAIRVLCRNFVVYAIYGEIRSRGEKRDSCTSKCKRITTEYDGSTGVSLFLPWIRPKNGPYFAVILLTVIRHCIQHRICAVYGRMYALFLLNTVVKHRPGLRYNTMRKRSVYDRLRSYTYRIVRVGKQRCERSVCILKKRTV